MSKLAVSVKTGQLHGVHDVHRAHYLNLFALLQDGMPSCLPQIPGAVRSLCSRSWAVLPLAPVIS